MGNNYASNRRRLILRHYDTDGLPFDNLITAPEDFSDVGWTKSQTSVLANNTTAPDGSLTADRITNTGGASSVSFRGIACTKLDHYVSVYAKAGVGNNLLTVRSVSFDVSNDVGFNLNTGLIEPNRNGVMEFVGDGWYRCVVFNTITLDDLVGDAYFYSSNALGGFTSTADDYLYLWGATLTQSPTIVDYL